MQLTSANIGGGGSRSDVWCSGTMASLTEAARTLVQFDRSFEPNAALRGHYDDKFGRYLELYRALQPFNAGYG